MSKLKNNKFKLYKASAGSGKTYTLVKEYLLLCLAHDNRSCKDILAVTFTNKAANEMKVKILHNLEGIANGYDDCSSMKNDLMLELKIDENTLKNRAEALFDTILHNYSDFSISTIDSFVQQISRNFSKELNLPHQYKVLIDDDDLLDELIQSIDSKIVDDNKYLTDILTDFVNFQIDEENSWRVDIAIRDFIKKLLKESAYKKGENLEIKPLSAEEYQNVKASLNDINKKCRKNIDDNIDSIVDFENKFSVTQNDYQDKSRGLPSLLKKIKKNIDVEPSAVLSSTVRKILDREKDWFSKNIDKTVIDNINKSGVDVVGLYMDLVKSHQNLFLVNLVRKNLYLYALRGTLVDIINQHIEETNKVHISEFNKRISDIIGDCSVPFIYERIGNRYKHFFIDEFQDTSLLQWQNFLPLINNSLSEGKMNLLVGDAKQAIYRFRSGEVEQIIKLPQIYTDDESESIKEYEKNLSLYFENKSLDTNYRSRKNIVDFNNTFFKLSKNKLTSVNYRNVYDNNLKQKCSKDNEYEGYVSVQVFDMECFENDDNISKNALYKEAVKQSVLDDIASLRKNNFKYSDITILIRNNSDGSDIADFLAKNNVPVISSDSILLKSSDKVRLIILTLKYFTDNNNDVVKLSLSFYKNICGDQEKSYDIQEALKENLDTGRLDELLRRSFSLYDLCCGIVKMYNFNVVEDVFLQYFMNLVHEWQNNENEGVEAFVEYWDKKSDSFFVKISSDIDAVQIMTIHKSKGLEFKVVLYPYAYTKVPDRFHGNEKWLPLDNIDQLKDVENIKNFVLPVNKSLAATNMEHHYTEEVDKASFDDFNIMYVAMTRPSDLMFVYTNNKVTEDSYNFFVDFFDAGNAYAEDAEKDDLKIIDSFDVEISDSGKKYILGSIVNKEKKNEQIENIIELDGNEPPHPIVWTDILKMEPDPTMFWSSEENDFQPEEWGNLVHEILAKINTVDDSGNIINNYVEQGTIDEKRGGMLLQQFQKIMEIDEIKAAYSKDAVIRNEMEILTSDKKILRPDRYAELDDKVILIDYKTGRQHEKYYEQLRNYMAALHDMGIRKNIEAYLLYIGDKIEIEQVFLDRLF